MEKDQPNQNDTLERSYISNSPMSKLTNLENPPGDNSDPEEETGGE